MALSEHEQRLLEEMERGLYASEADSLKTRSEVKKKPSYKAILVGALAIIAGVGALIGAVVLGQIWLGLVGFVIMLAGVLFTVSPKNQVVEGSASSPNAKSETMAERAERRWEERMDGDR